jgi:hypothetical protein
MAGEETIKPEGGTVRLAGIIEADSGGVGELKRATCER